MKKLLSRIFGLLGVFYVCSLSAQDTPPANRERIQLTVHAPQAGDAADNFSWYQSAIDPQYAVDACVG